MSEGLSHIMGVLFIPLVRSRGSYIVLTLFMASGLYCKDRKQHCPIELPAMMGVFLLNIVAISHT